MLLIAKALRMALEEDLMSKAFSEKLRQAGVNST